MTTAATTMIPIAKVGRPHGLKGELHLRPYNMQSELISAGLRAVVRAADGGAEVAVEIVSARPAGPQAVVVKLKGVADRTAAEALVHGEVFVARDTLPPADEDEVYLVDTIGLPVLLARAGGEPFEIGVVTSVFETGANDVLVVKLTRGGPELLVPVIPQAFDEMRPETGRIVLAPLEAWAPDDLVIEGGPA
jgi:16S rRNA processing protein RimM